MKSLLLFAAVVLCVLTTSAGELQNAAGAGDIEKVRALIKANPGGVNAREAGTTALHEATRAGHLEIVKLLVASGANVNATDFSGLTPLRLAQGSGRLLVADFLRQNGGLEKVTAAPRAAMPANAVLQRSGLFATNTLVAPPSNVSTLGTTNAPPAQTAPVIPAREPTERELLPALFPIHEAARVGDVEQIKFLFQNAPDIVNATDQKGLTPLHVAAANKQFEVAQTLLGLHANVNVRASNGQTPLHVAVRNGDVAIAGLLITNRAVVDVRDKLANTPLLVALQSADAEVMDIGSSSTGNYLAENEEKKMARARAMTLKKQQLDLTILLLRNNADPNARNGFGTTPLTRAVRLGNESIVDLLLARGANPNVIETESTRAPLHIAAMRGPVVVVQALLRGGAKVNAVDGRGETALCYALREARADTIAALRAAGGTIGAVRTLNPTEKSLVDFYRNTEAALQRTSSTEKGKILIALNPTKADCEKMFPRYAPAAWKVVDQINQQIRLVFKNPVSDAEQGKEIWRILPDSPSPAVQEWRGRGLIASDLPVFSLTVDKVGASNRPGDYCFVNGHWVTVPPLPNIAAQMAAAEPGRR